MHRVITVPFKEIETIMYFSYFSNNFSYFSNNFSYFSNNFSYLFPKIDNKIRLNFHQNMKKFVQRIPQVSSNFLHNFSKFSKKHFQYFLYNFHKIGNIKLLRCVLIIFPKLIRHLLRNFSNNFLKLLGDFIKMFKILVRSQSKITQEFSPNFQHFFKVSRK